MPGFLSVNGILTGSLIDSPIVNYNENEIIGFRIFTIPIEDSFYGFTQFVLVWYFFQYFSKRSTVKLPNKERAV
jgi:lycopene cyclase domain-containing protein